MSQMGHAIAQYFIEHPELAKEWNNNYLISLSIESERKLEQLLTELSKQNIPVSWFTEPDIGNQLTSICFRETHETKRYTNKLPLTLKN